MLAYGLRCLGEARRGLGALIFLTWRVVDWLCVGVLCQDVRSAVVPFLSLIFLWVSEWHANGLMRAARIRRHYFGVDRDGDCSEVVTVGVYSGEVNSGDGSLLLSSVYLGTIIRCYWNADRSGRAAPVEGPRELENNQLPVVISSAFILLSESQLLEVLRISYKGNSPGVLQDYKRDELILSVLIKILMEDEFKPSVQPQRRVKLNIKNVVKKKAIKLLDA
ncbi:hypothetical protein Tco_1354937 [Tanacetum coccineum]